MSFPHGLVGLPNFLTLFGLGIPVLPTDPTYKANVLPEEQEIVLGMSVIFDARNSVGAGGNPPDNYYWFFVQVPIGSRVAQVGIESLEIDDSRIMITPDVTGIYELGLIVGDSNFLSEPVYVSTYVKIMVVPYGKGLTPDVSFLWNYLGDFWQNFRDRDIFSTMWSGFTQVAGARMLSLYQSNFNKSIATIQELFQKRWIQFQPRLEIKPSEYYAVLGDDYAGTQAQSIKFNIASDLFIDQVAIPKTEGSFAKTPYGKKIGNRHLRYWQSSHLLYRGEDVTVFVIIPIDVSLFLTKEKEVIQSGVNHTWRLSNTLYSKVYDFEKLGVKYGDSLSLRISLFVDGVTSGRHSFFDAFIVGAKDNSIGFTFSKVTDGVPDSGIPDVDIVRLCNELLIPGAQLVNNVVVYESNSLAEYIRNIVTAVFFKRDYYEIDLFTNEFNLGVFNGQKILLKIEPVAVDRKRAIYSDSNIYSIPNFQEYIEQPIISEKGGKKYITTRNLETEITKDPYFLFENLDYIVSNETLNVYIKGLINTDIIEVFFGDLLDRGFEQGDYLYVDNDTYLITEIIDKTYMRISTGLKATYNNKKAKIERRLKGCYIRFCKDILTEAPIRGLWAEEVFLDNNEAIQNNFGALVNLTLEQFRKLNVTTPYKPAVNGLMYGDAKGPTINNLKIGAQILLGLPFAYTKGVIVDIKPNYSLRPDYSPEYGRIIIEEVDRFGVPTGLTNIYFYPRGPQRLILGEWVPVDPEFTGLAINPATGKEYVLGDIVEQFAVLSKGVEIEDYIKNPSYVKSVTTSFEDELQKYHTFFLRVNLDVTNGPNLKFVIDYLLRMKPSYTTMKAFAQIKLIDTITITDKFAMIPTSLLFDVEGISLPTANVMGSYVDSQYIFNVSGEMYSRYIKGFDLVSNGSTTVTSIGGGFVTQRVNELHDSPFISAGDLVKIYGGVNDGEYRVVSVIDDTTLVLDTALPTAQDQRFSIYKQIENPIYTGSATVTGGSNNITVPSGNLSAGVTVGDYIYFYGTLVSTPYRIVAINNIVLTVDKVVTEPSNTYTFKIFRDSLLTNFLLQESLPTFVCSLLSGDPWIVLNTGDEYLIPKKGDVLYVTSYPPFEIMDVDINNRKVYAIPAPTMNDTQDGYIERLEKPLGFPIELHTTTDSAELTISPTTSTVTTISGNDVITFSFGTNLYDWNILPGDFFKAINGFDATVDYGYGAGYVPIVEVSSSTSLKLTRPTVATQNNVTYKLARRR